MESVKQHRRRRPDDGPRFVVKVRHYWRHHVIGGGYPAWMAFRPKKHAR